MIWRAPLLFAAWLLVLACLAGLGTIAMLATETGTRWLLAAGLRFVPGQASVAHIDGNLLSSLTLHELRYRNGGKRMELERLHLRWNLDRLPAGVLSIKDLRINGVRYTAPREDTADEAAELPQRIGLPLAVDIEQSQITGVEVRIGDEVYRLQQLSLSARGDAERWIVRELNARAQGVELVLRGEADAVRPFVFTANAHWSASLPANQGLMLGGTGRLTGNINQVQLDHWLSRPFDVDTHGTISLSTDQPRADLAGAWSALQWPLTEAAEYRSEKGEYRIKGSLQDYVVSLRGNVSGKALPPMDVDLHGRGDRQMMNIESLRLTMPEGRFDIAGRVSWQPEPGWDLNVAGENIDPGVRWPDLSGDLTLDAKIKGVVQDRRVQTTAHIEKLHGSLRDEALSVSGELTLKGDELSADLDVAYANAGFAISGDAQTTAGFPFRASVDWSAPLPKGMGDGLWARGSGVVSGDKQGITLEQELEAPFLLTAAGTVSLEGEHPVVDLRGDWRQARWPLSGDALYHSADGRYEVSGHLDDYALTVNGAVSGMEIPDAALELQGNGNRQRLLVSALTAYTLGGKIVTTGEVDWAQTLQWDAKIHAEQINPGNFWKAWPGNLAANTRVSGKLEGERLDIVANVQRLEGSLRGQAFEADGDFASDGNTLTTEAINIRSGPNRLKLNGSLGQRLDMQFEIDASAIAGLVPHGKGALSGKGQLSGQVGDPAITASLQARDLGYTGYSVASAKADIAFNPRDAKSSTSTIVLRDARVQGRIIESVQIDVRGNAAQHEADIDVASQQVQLKTTLAGALRNSVWNGDMRRLSVRQEQLGEWRLREQRVPMTIGANRLSVGDLCIAREQSSLCGAGEWNTKTGIKARGEITALPFGLLEPLLPEDVSLAGEIDGEFRARGKADALEAELTAETESIVLELDTGEGAPVGARFTDLQFDASYRQDRAELDFGMSLQEAGRIEAHIEAGGVSRHLQGNITADVPNLEFLAAMVPELREIEGRIAADVTLSGQTDAPIVTGSAFLENGSVQIPQAGLTLRDIELTATSIDSRNIGLRGSASSGDGNMSLDGMIDLTPDREFPLNVKIEGENFEVAHLPEIRATASPALDIKARADRVHVTGKLLVPAADITLTQLPASAVRASDDAVLVSQSAETRKSRRPVHTYATIGLELGDAVTFSGFGATAQLRGDLLLTKTPDNSTRARGEIDVVEGQFKRYGQDLKIDSGKFIFSGPLNNPNLDITASRKAGDVTAGIEIFGTAKRPQSRVFSDPSMSESNALSYLLTGKPAAGTTQAEGDSLAQAAVSLGLREVSKGLGLKGVAIESTNEFESSATAVGAYLVPDLYVGYAFNLFDRFSGVLLKYQLNDSLSLEAQSGSSQSLDLFYSIDR